MDIPRTESEANNFERLLKLLVGPKPPGAKQAPSTNGHHKQAKKERGLRNGTRTRA